MRSYANLVHPQILGVWWSCDRPMPGPFPAPPPNLKPGKSALGTKLLLYSFWGFPMGKFCPVVMCRWDTGTPSLHSWFSWIFLPYTKLNFPSPSLSKSCNQPTLSSFTRNFKESTEKIVSFVWMGRIRVWQILIGVIKMYFSFLLGK